MNTTPERPLEVSSPADPATVPRPAARLSLGVRLVLALGIFCALALWRLVDTYPPLENPLTFDLVLERGEPGRSDPLIVGGDVGRANFLAVRFDDERTVRFLYDSWGFPGLHSSPVPVPDEGRLRLRVVMPAIDQIHGGHAIGEKRVRVECNGSVVLDSEVHFYVRRPDQIYFGTNPLGGTVCGPALHGEITLEDGRIVRGGAAHIFTPAQRATYWLVHLPWQAGALAVVSALFAFKLHRLRSLRARIRTLPALALAHRWFVGTTAICTFFYTWLVTLGTFNLNQSEVFGSFYDYQVASFLAGRLDVPEDAIGGEAFEARGKLYGYFGPTPALLRLPFALTGFAFGKLSRACMLLYFVASLVATYLILRDATRRIRTPRASSAPANITPSPFATVALLASTGLGSTVFFLGSRGLIFHEAILSGITFALWSAWCSFRHLHAPERRWWIGALVCGIASVHCRPPTGLFALTLLGCVALFTFARGRTSAGPAVTARRTFAICSLCAMGFLSLNALAWLKFRTFDAAPLRLSRPYMGSDRLAHVDGKSFHLVNLPYNFYVYFGRPNLRFSPNFPWIFHGPPLPDDWFPSSKIDLPDHTVGPPFAMPSLFILATLGCIVALRTAPVFQPAIICLWTASVPMTLALFAAIATAQRYTGDFCPALISGSALALAALENPFRLRRTFRLATALLTFAAIAITAALTLHYQGSTLWGVPAEIQARYQTLRTTVDGFFGVAPPPSP